MNFTIIFSGWVAKACVHDCGFVCEKQIFRLNFYQDHLRCVCFQNENSFGWKSPRQRHLLLFFGPVTIMATTIVGGHPLEQKKQRMQQRKN